jgi:predicted dienelactone hydrolase
MLAGATPDWPVMLCRFSSQPRACTGTMRKTFQALPDQADPRIKAAVLADPPGHWLAADGFASVQVPIQLWASETGGRGLPNIGMAPENVAAIERSLPKKPEYHVVPNTGHFAFMLCGPSIKAIPAFCTDAPGFDRTEFHKRFNADIVRFFRARIGGR